MAEDRRLVQEVRRGDAEALRRIYEKYRHDLLRLAMSLTNDAATAEDVVHDVFVSFIRQRRQFELTGSLKSYLATCVAHRARNVNRAQRVRKTVLRDEAASAMVESGRADQWLVCSEELRQISDVLALLSGEQREAITLRLQGGMKFREIAEFQHVPLKTAISRCRGGLLKLRSLLNGKVSECDR